MTKRVTAAFLAAASGFFLLQPASAQDSPRLGAAQRLEVFLAGSDDASLDRFVEEQISPSMRKDYEPDMLRERLRELRAQFAGAEPQGARPAGPTSVELTFVPGPKGRASLKFSIEPEPPHRFIAIEFEGDAPDAWQLVKPGMSDEEMVRAASAFLDELAARGEFSGAVLLAKGETPLLRKAYGMASRRYDVPNRPDTKFNLGSINKMFTGLAICQLVQQGKLSLDDTVGEHLPDYPNAEVAAKVTIRHLLTHTSGLGSYWNERYQREWKWIRTVTDLLSTFADEPLAFRPGTRFGYSNAGPVVLGLIIEKITGESYYDYVRENIYEPAGMTDTDCYAIDIPVANLAMGYTRLDPKTRRPGETWRENTLLHSIKGGPAGGGYSTLDDLHRFALAVQSHKLLDPEHTRLYLEGKVEFEPGLYYSCLIDDDRAGGHRRHGHNGGGPGISAEFAFYPDMGFTVAVLSNVDNGAVKPAGFLRALIERRPSSIPPSVGDPEAVSLPDAGAPPFRLGIMLDVRPDTVSIARALPGSPAEKAGLRAGDELVSANGRPLGRRPMAVLDHFLQSPDPIEFVIRREGKEMTVAVTPERVAH